MIIDIIEKLKNSEKIAIKCGSDAISYSELYNNVKIAASCIKQYENFSEKIGIFLPNSIQYAIAYFTITFLNSVIVPIGVQTKTNELKSTIKYCELGLIITSSYYIKILKTYLNDFEYEVSVFNIDDNSMETLGFAGKKLNYSILNEEDNEDSVAILLHTSGTTSNPKRVMLSHKNLISNVKSIIESLQLTENDKTLITLPMYLASANASQFLTHIYLGAQIVIMDNVFMAKKFFSLIQEEKITNFTGVPSIYILILEYKYKLNYDISSLRFACFGGGKMPINTLKQLLKTFPKTNFIHMYGQTEATTRISHLLPHDSLRKLGSTGLPIPNVKVRIVNENMEDVQIGEIGEIIVKGDNVMKGYFNRWEESNKTIKDGWLFTGDLGKFDDEGYIYITGRRKNVIISGGMNIYPEELEEVLSSYPGIKEVCVLGKSDPLLGEVPIANVVLKSGYKEILESDIINFCVRNFSSYKAPSKVNIVESLPKTASGKLIRH